MLKKTISYTVGIFLFLCFVYSFIEPFIIEETVIEIKSPQIPEELSGKKIIFLSDIHHGIFFSKNRLNKLLSQVQSLSPDLILLGGDYADGNEKYLKQVADSLSEIKTPMGKPIGVMGNHDYSFSNEAIKYFLNADFEIMNNENIELSYPSGDLIIAGVDDLKIGTPNIDKALEGTDDNDFIILISHHPDVSEQAEAKKADLILSGHTHGGQVNLFGLWAPITMSKYGQKYIKNINKTSYNQTITSRGIGTVDIPVRFFSKPQIITLKLTSTPKASIKIGDKTIKAELATTKEKQKTGLMNRESLCLDCGMLFVFETEKKHSFWMKNTLIPLDMVFINKDKTIVDIKRAQPCKEEQCPSYTPQEKNLYVLEVPINTFSNDLIGQTASIQIN